jgi:hypothetical protein
MLNRQIKVTWQYIITNEGSFEDAGQVTKAWKNLPTFKTGVFKPSLPKELLVEKSKARHAAEIAALIGRRAMASQNPGETLWLLW